MLSTGNLMDAALGMVAELVAVPEGREAMATRMAAFGRWQGNTLIQAAGTATAEDWAATIALAVDKGADLPCDQLQRLSARYSRDGLAAPAKAIEDSRASIC